MTTMRRTLLLWLLGGIGVSTVLAGLISFAVALHAADRLFDRQLAHIASNLPFKILPQPEPPDNGDPSDDIVIQVRDEGGNPIYPTRPSVQIPDFQSTGYHMFETKETRWRVYTQQQQGRYVHVAQSEDVRRRLAIDLAISTALPFLALIPLLALIIWHVVGRSASLMQGVAQAMERRSAGALHPLPTEEIPGEVRPMVAALNDLLSRLEQSMEVQRTFIADAAHELRSPVTALKLHLQITERAVTGEQRDAAFAKVRERLVRIAHLVEQLLRLAREEPSGLERPVGQVWLGALLQSVVGDFAPVAENEGISLTCTPVERDTAAIGQVDSLRILFSNLIDNALRYTEKNGRVTVSLVHSADATCVLVDDDGPGIPEDERERVFNRFHRLNGGTQVGSGLGLAIVRAIADRHRCVVSLHDGPMGRGLRVKVMFPVS